MSALGVGWRPFIDAGNGLIGERLPSDTGGDLTGVFCVEEYGDVGLDPDDCGPGEGMGGGRGFFFK